MHSDIFTYILKCRNLWNTRVASSFGGLFFYISRYRITLVPAISKYVPATFIIWGVVMPEASCAMALGGVATGSMKA